MSRMERSPLISASRNACTRLEMACISSAGVRGTGLSGCSSQSGSTRARGVSAGGPTLLATQLIGALDARVPAGRRAHVGNRRFAHLEIGEPAFGM